MAIQNAAIVLAAFYLASPSHAQTPVVPQHVSVGDKPTILYDGLSTKSNKLFILPRFQPLEILVRLDKWTKVRDAEGTIGWVENSTLGDRRFVQVSANTADIRAAALSTSPLVFEAQRSVVLEVTGPIADGWLPVRHRDGQSGFVRSTQVWGG